MAYPTYVKRSYSGGGQALTLTEDVTSSALTFGVTGNFSNWPTGATGTFMCSVDGGLASEEKVLFSGFNPVTGTLTVWSTGTETGRGYDKTTATSHVPLATNSQIELAWSATEAAEANHAVFNTVGKVTTAGDLIVASGANAFTRVPAGSNGNVLVATGSGATWETIAVKFGLNSSSTAILTIGGGPQSEGTSTLASKANHRHTLGVPNNNTPIKGTIPGTAHPAWRFQVWYGTAAITGPTHIVSVTLPAAYSHALMGAWVQGASGANQGFADLTTSLTSLSVIAIKWTDPGTSSSVVFSLLTLGV